MEVTVSYISPKMKTALLVLALLAAASAAPKTSKMGFRSLYKKPIKALESKPKPHLIGGQEATPGAYPYQAFLEMDAWNHGAGWYCNGAIITQLHILTSAYCVDGALGADITLGAHNPNQVEETQFTASSGILIIHEEYDAVKIINDIGIVVTNLIIEYSVSVQPALLPADDTQSYAGVLAIITGWGVTDVHDERLSDVLRFLQARIISNEECSDYYGTLDDSIVCTEGAPNVGTCHGDSGAPLVTYGTLVGIASFGVGYCEVYPSAFTRVSSFLGWIHEHTNKET